MDKLTNSQIALIGGTGFDNIESLEVADRKTIKTPYGDPSGEILSGRIKKKTFLFLPRHGMLHSIPPHRVNYRANLWALKTCGATKVIAFAAVGGISANLTPGTIVIPDQLIDYTSGRNHTFFDGDADNVTHIDFTEPYSPTFRNSILAAATAADVRVVNSGCYGATQGPRLETAAEINRMDRDGATIVGMTGMPEAALARELDLEYVCIAIVVNAAAGRGDGEISMEKIRQELKSGATTAIRILTRL